MQFKLHVRFERGNRKIAPKGLTRSWPGLQGETGLVGAGRKAEQREDTHVRSPPSAQPCIGPFCVSNRQRIHRFILLQRPYWVMIPQEWTLALGDVTPSDVLKGRRQRILRRRKDVQAQIIER